MIIKLRRDNRLKWFERNRGDRGQMRKQCKFNEEWKQLKIWWVKIAQKDVINFVMEIFWICPQQA